MLLIWLAVIFGALTLYLCRNYYRFKGTSVKYLTPFPLLGTFWRVVFRIEHFVDDIARGYFSFPGEKFIGAFQFTKPYLVIRDLELIKKITVKDFEHFLDHTVIIDSDSDPLFGRNLASLRGQKWKDMRSTLSPAFTSSKIRVMVPFMVDVGDQMIKVVKRKIQDSENDYIDIDVKDLTARYANDVIASCAFGLKVDSHTDEQNQFYMKGKETTTPSLKQVLKVLGILAFPKLMSKLKISLFTEDTKHFFRSLVLNTIKDREERHIVRPDMIHLLMEARKGNLSHDEKSEKTENADAGFAAVEESSVGRSKINRVWSDDDLIAQAVVFFIAGFETVSTAMSFLLHELAVNPDVQEKLVQEIIDNDEKNDGKFDYNSIQEMKYLDMVVSELLRFWPPAVATDRICVKDYNLGKPSDQATEDYIIRKGEGVAIPVWSLHRDPKYFPDPLKFDPERFSEENKHNIKPFTYMPFGLGPRNCIGSRFALCELKVMTYQILRNMQVSPAAKTILPAELNKNVFGVQFKGGHWIRFSVRNYVN